MILIQVTGKMIFETSGATVALMELNQYFSILSNFSGYYYNNKGILELNSMKLSIPSTVKAAYGNIPAVLSYNQMDVSDFSFTDFKIKGYK